MRTGRWTPSRYVAIALLVVGLLQVGNILLILAPSPGLDHCSLDFFGVRFPPNGDGCYVPIGVPALLAVATFGIAALVGSARWRR